MNQPSEAAAARAGIPRYKSWGGLALFRQGFRPFFLASGVSAAVLLSVWIMMLARLIDLPGAIFAPAHWHAHEMIFGTLAAAVAGFLLTAIPNWTGRMPLQGWPLVGLFGLWLAGRGAMVTAEMIGLELAAVIDVSFLFVLLAVVVREIVSGRNWRNLPVIVALALLGAANAAAHLETLGYIDTYDLGMRGGISVIALLIGLIGGRIIPSFTNNWLAKRNVTQRPRPFGRFDTGVMALTAAALGLWTFLPYHDWTGYLLVAAGAGNALRFMRWQGARTLAEPLVWSLHAAYAWLPLGLIFLGLSYVTADMPETAGLHALTAGAMGGMILAVMTRATLGHTGRTLAADRWTTLIYVLGLAAAVARVAAALSPVGYDALLMTAGVTWIAAFGLFSVRYGAILLRR
ncbi:MAG: NnrS family protein [Rhodospirillales bacterium]|nr:NnrS family protein [Rhodospirillales bacterium]MBO6788378.1 NnrS family protein [Rhodospirillales bacterium]